MGLSKTPKQRGQGKSLVLVDSSISEYNVAVTMATAIEALDIIAHWEVQVGGKEDPQQMSTLLGPHYVVGFFWVMTKRDLEQVSLMEFAFDIETGQLHRMNSM